MFEALCSSKREQSKQKMAKMLSCIVYKKNVLYSTKTIGGIRNVKKKVNNVRREPESCCSLVAIKKRFFFLTSKRIKSAKE